MITSRDIERLRALGLPDDQLDRLEQSKEYCEQLRRTPEEQAEAAEAAERRRTILASYGCSEEQYELAKRAMGWGR
jgi:hypothetical protein